MDSGIHPTLHSEFHHQIIYSKLNLKIEYSPPYAREVCDYGKAQFNLINGTIENFYWNNFFLAIITIIRSNSLIRNIEYFLIFHPSKVILCDNNEPPWVNDEIRLLIKQKQLMFQTQRGYNRLDLSILNKLFNHLTNVIASSKLANYRRTIDE